MKEYKGKINLIEQVSSDCYKMIIDSNLDNIRSGQFISILCPTTTLRRPFSACDFDKNKKQLSIIFKLRGEGTNYLKSLKEGDEINFIAPLGNGFKIEHKKSLLIGAGIGIAPMLFLKKEMDLENIDNFLISGFKAQNEIIKGSDENIVGGSVLDDIEKIIKQKNIELIYCCGPLIVLKKLAKIALDMDIKCYLALERMMACSIGVCRGCVIKTMKNNEMTYSSVCKDGPVFLGSEIIWD